MDNERVNHLFTTTSKKLHETELAKQKLTRQLEVLKKEFEHLTTDVKSQLTKMIDPTVSTKVYAQDIQGLMSELETRVEKVGITNIAKTEGNALILDTDGKSYLTIEMAKLRIAELQVKVEKLEMDKRALKEELKGMLTRGKEYEELQKVLTSVLEKRKSGNGTSSSGKGKRKTNEGNGNVKEVKKPVSRAASPDKNIVVVGASKGKGKSMTTERVKENVSPLRNQRI